MDLRRRGRWVATEGLAGTGEYARNVSHDER